MIPVSAMPEGLCGMYVSTAETDYVYTTSRTTPFHRQHIALHEIGHLLADHQGGAGTGELAAALLPDLNPALVRAVLGRTGYTSEQEREAEYFATLVTQRSRPAQADRRMAAADPVIAAVLDRLDDTWGRSAFRRSEGRR
ncbi:hypothetical protein [Actinomadura roseirufa]|uniref:hypothetical protein n=1 Tax=Actinomadura roseirufa TaxID=2094049 RepID=UPI0010410DCD|nr:hypothetical protein [Actinomadura roseirufa]